MAPTPTEAEVLSEAFDIRNLIVNKGYGAKGLSDMNLKAVPKKYIQPIEERLDESTLLANESIPVIDLSKWPDDPKVADLVCDAAENCGFFQVINHGVPKEVLQNVKDATHRFFGLSPEEKLSFNSKKDPVNTNAPHTTSFVPAEAEKALEWKDKLHLVYVSDEEAQSLWPSICRDEVLEYVKSCNVLARKLLTILLQRLNVKEFDEEVETLVMGVQRVNMNYYPKCPQPELTIGVGRHSDISTITILLQDDIGGLQVRKLDTDSWISATPIPGAMVINIGDALQIMSNGRYKSIEHRVLSNRTDNRVSVPLFLFPKPSQKIGPLPQVLQNGDKPIYKRVLFSDYTKHFFSKTHHGKDTLEFAKI